jgi:hypothetical protein
MASIFNISALGIGDLTSLSTNNLINDIQSNRVVITVSGTDTPYTITLPYHKPTYNFNILAADEGGFCTWIDSSNVIPLSDGLEGNPLIFQNGAYKFSDTIYNMKQIKQDSTTNSSSFLFNPDNSIYINTNKSNPFYSFVSFLTNSISFGFNGTSAVNITKDSITVPSKLIIGSYKLEVINDELTITKWDSTTNSYVSGTLIVD